MGLHGAHLTQSDVRGLMGSSLGMSTGSGEMSRPSVFVRELIFQLWLFLARINMVPPGLPTQATHSQCSRGGQAGCKDVNEILQLCLEDKWSEEEGSP